MTTARGFELDEAIRRLTARVRRDELEFRRQRMAGSTGISDPNSYFVSPDVEGALAELAEALQAANGPAIDRALTGDAWSQGAIPEFAVVQSATQRDTLATSLTLTLGATPTVGNLLVIWHVTRAAPTPTGPSSGWTAHPDGVASAAGAGEHGAMFYRVVETGDGAAWVSNNSAGCQSAAILVEIAGAGLVQDSAEVNDGSGTTMSASVTPTGAAVILGGAVVAHGDTVAATVTPTAPTVEIAELWSNPTTPRKPTAWLGYRLAAAGGTYAVDGTVGVELTPTWGMQALAFAVGARPWNVAEPNVNDGDDATYEELTETPVVMIDLGAEYQITSTRLLIGCETAGAKTYVIRGSVDPSFDPDLTATLATLNFAATGTYTPDEVLASWAAGTVYRYFELSGTDETRRIFSWELLQDPFAIILAAEDVTYDGSSVGSAAADVQAALDELFAAAPGLVVQEVDGSPAVAASEIAFPDGSLTVAGTVVTPHLLTSRGGGRGELDTRDVSGAVTLDLAAYNAFQLTLIGNVTSVTLSNPPPSGVDATWPIALMQGGSGGYTWAWPASAKFRAADGTNTGSAPTLATAVGAQDDFDLSTSNGGTDYGVTVGGGSSGTPATTVTDETSFGITPAAGTDTEYARQDHTHGTPANPVTEAAVSALGFVGPILITDTPAGSPLVFADLLQTEAGDDLLYADV